MRPNLLALVAVLLLGSYACRESAAEPGSRWWPFGGEEAEQTNPFDAVEDSATATDQQVQQAQPAEQQTLPSASEPAASETAGEEPEQGWMIDSNRGKVSWPRLHLPEMPKPRMPQFLAQEPEDKADLNAWAEEPDITPARRSPWQVMTGGARRVGDSTRAAWDKTFDALTPGDQSSDNSSRVARRNGRPPWWKRMFAVEDRDLEPEGPQTVTEWMAQERLDP
jgi:hypothetical protein